MNQKKTIFFTISRAIIVRNFLLNPSVKVLRDRYNVVILTPLYDDPEFKKLFGNDYILEPLYNRQISKLEQFFISLHKALIYNPTIQLCSEYGLMLKNEVSFKKFRNWFEKYIIANFFAWNWSRVSLKWLDAKVFSCDLYDELIKKYNPVMVFISAIGADSEVMLLRNCKRFGIPSIAMTQTWDNLSKYGMRERANLLAVWSEYMKEEAIKFQTYKDKDVKVIGIPQFDYYQSLVIDDCATFFNKFKLDLNKKIIFFGSEGPVCQDDPYVVSFLQEKIKDGTLADYQILVRPHFAYKQDVDRFLRFVDNNTVFMDNDYEQSGFKDGTSLTLRTVKNLIAEIKYSSALITSASTLVLDIIANSKVPILYNFDRNKATPYGNSIKRLYTSSWFREVFKAGLNCLANSEEELVAMIKNSEVFSDKISAQCQKVVQRFCYKIDGGSGKRLFNLIDDIVNFKSI